MDLELELISDKAEKYGGHAVPLARVNVVALSSQPVDHDKRLINDPNERLGPEFSDEEEEFSSEGEAEGSDSEPTLEVHRRKSRAKIPTNARVSAKYFHEIKFNKKQSMYIGSDCKFVHCFFFTAKKLKAKIHSSVKAV